MPGLGLNFRFHRLWAKCKYGLASHIFIITNGLSSNYPSFRLCVAGSICHPSPLKKIIILILNSLFYPLKKKKIVSIALISVWKSVGATVKEKWQNLYFMSILTPKKKKKHKSKPKIYLISPYIRQNLVTKLVIS